MTKVSTLNQWDITPGVMPSSDATPFDVPCWVSSQGIRFDPESGRPRKIGGWQSQDFDYGAQIKGVARTLFSATINQKVYTVIGTNSYLYSLIGSSLTNITPLDTNTIAIPNSLSTHYGLLGNDPFTTTNGSRTVVVTDPDADLYKVGDRYTLSGATTTNGIPDTQLNATHVIRAVGSGTISIFVAASASSSGTGGGASVNRTDGLITVTDTAHGQEDGDRVKITLAADTGGILAVEINLEFLIRNVTPNTFDVMTIGTATSAVTAAGGAATLYQQQIPPGAENAGVAQGYGAGLYGVGLYGTALTSTLGSTYPRIWSIDRFGDSIVMTPGNRSGAYVWAGSNAVAPALIANAPTDINYLFVSDNVLVTFGHDVENKIYASDQGDLTQWTASATNQVFEDVIEGAGRFISHVSVDGYSLIFTEQQTWTFKFIGGTLVWQVLPLDLGVGLIGPSARCSVAGIAYWAGQDNYYLFRGGKIEVIPSNFGPQSSLVRYVYDDFNYSQRFKIFMWYNEKFDEVWEHYPTDGSNEPNVVSRFSRKLFAWCPDVMDRTCAEYPNSNLSNPRLINVDTLYIHESGTDADGEPLPFSITTKKFLSGKDTATMTVVIPDNNMTGTVSLNVNMRNYPQSANPMANNDYVLTPTTETIQMQNNGRYWQYTISGSELGQSFLMGQWQDEPQKGPTAK